MPFARYVVENAGYLAFPFRRYQIQKVWRGERPQEGRAREFTQADIDIVGDGDLPFRYDVEIALVIAEALSALPIPAFLLRINNRKLAEGFYNGIGLTDTAGVLRSIDKLEKIGPAKVAELLKSELGATDEQAQSALKLAVDPHRGHLLRGAGPRARGQQRTARGGPDRTGAGHRGSRPARARQGRR